MPTEDERHCDARGREEAETTTPVVEKGGSYDAKREKERERERETRSFIAEKWRVVEPRPSMR
ncbi:hypothetical protein TIFTF001_012024 [Ficus carica]|uniref:Uncharacterized protein n=1 Tax=Ficus carica TaxID=3494 RepID=A0AA88DI00_FICCA|nr:hypothetical protein TIFTF001_012024 [Ficus carica]